jgi:hypothetical protein
VLHALRLFLAKLHLRSVIPLSSSRNIFGAELSIGLLVFFSKKYLPVAAQ